MFLIIFVSNFTSGYNVITYFYSNLNWIQVQKKNWKNNYIESFIDISLGIVFAQNFKLNDKYQKNILISIELKSLCKLQ